VLCRAFAIASELSVESSESRTPSIIILLFHHAVFFTAHHLAVFPCCLQLALSIPVVLVLVIPA
jgi:hypothetical protein